VGLFTDGFGLRPLVFDGIEIRRIGRQVFQSVTGLTKGVLNILVFVEGGIIQDDHGGGGQLREKNRIDPGEEGIGVDTGLEEADGEQMKA